MIITPGFILEVLVTALFLLLAAHFWISGQNGSRRHEAICAAAVALIAGLAVEAEGVAHAMLVAGYIACFLFLVVDSLFEGAVSQACVRHGTKVMRLIGAGMVATSLAMAFVAFKAGLHDAALQRITFVVGCAGIPFLVYPFAKSKNGAGEKSPATPQGPSIIASER
ncbi:MAG TPA: hypothetical protein VFQ72_03325 [Candidatus Paceibacterota bacterium]|nr:hypothetical protein [Candidatus Paceibacterota bacterium]